MVASEIQKTSGFAVVTLDARGALVYLTRDRRHASRNGNHAYLFKTRDVAEQMAASLAGFTGHPLSGRRGLVDVVPHTVERRVRPRVASDAPRPGRTRVRFPIFRRETADGAHYRFERPTDENHAWKHVCSISAPNGAVVRKPAPAAQHRLKLKTPRGRVVWLLPVEAYRAAMNRDHALELVP